jgi:hypothetical protein
MYHQMFYLLLLTMMSMAAESEDDSQERAICREILNATEVIKDQAKALYSVLIRKKKITTETTYEWATKENPSLRVAVMKWLGLALSKDRTKNWTHQTMMSDYELWNEHGTQSIKDWCRMNFPHDNDLRLKNEAILIKQRGRIYQRLYYLFHLVCNEMDLPHNPKPTPEQLVKDAIDAIVPDNTPTQNTPSNIGK